MALTKYTYSKTTDFTSLVGDDIWVVGLRQEIIDDATLPASQDIDEGVTGPDNVDIWFDPALTTQEETALDDVVAAHTGVIPTPKVLNVSIDQDYQYQSVKDACDWISSYGNPSVTNPWVVSVRPGVYSEDPFTIPTYTTIAGEGDALAFKLATKNDGAHFISLSAGAVLANVQIAGPANVGYAGVNSTVTGSVPAYLSGVAILSGYYGVWVHPASAGMLFIDGLVNIYSGSNIQEFLRVTDYGQVRCLGGTVQSYVDSSIAKGYVVEGPNTVVHLGTCQYRVPLGTAVYADNGADVHLCGCYIVWGAKGIHLAGTGTGTTVHAVGTSISTDVTVPVQTDTDTGTVYFNGTMEEEEVSLAASSTLVGLSVGNDTNIRGHLSVGGSQNRVRLDEYLRITGNTGYYTGGAVTRATGLDVDVTSGSGFYTDSGYSVVPVEWAADSLTLSANEPLIYIYVDGGGTVQSSITEPPLESTITVARAMTSASAVVFLARVTVPLDQHQAHWAEFQEKAVGVLNSSGTVVTQYSGPSLQFQVSAGEFFHLGISTPADASATPCSFTYWYRSATAGEWVAVTSQTSLDTGYYDDGSGTLAAMTAGKFKRDLAFVAVSDDGTEFHVVYGQEQFDTAVAADVNPSAPEALTNHSQRLAAFVLEESATDIEDIIDQRPRLGQLAPSTSGGGITVHNDLTGRDSSIAHTQYQLLSEKGAASGYAPLDADSQVPNTNLPYSTTAGADVSSAAAVVGAGEIAREGHTHKVLTAAPTQGIGGGNTEGVGPNLAMADHDHKLRETGGPTDLTIGAVADGQVLLRSGTTLVGAAAITSGATIADNRIVRGDGGAYGIQQSSVSIDDSGNIVPVGVAQALGLGTPWQRGYLNHQVGGVDVFNGTATLDDATFVVAQDGTYTLTLPTAAAGWWYLIERQGVTGTVTLAPAAGDTIIGGGSITLQSNKLHVLYAQNATDWRVSVIGDGGTVQPSSVPLLLNYFSSSGSDYAEVTSTSWTVIGSFEYPGTSVSPVTIFSAVVSRSGALGQSDIRLYDYTHALQIAAITWTAAAKATISTTSLSNLPTGASVLEVQAMATGAPKSRIHSTQLR